MSAVRTMAQRLRMKHIFPFQSALMAAALFLLAPVLALAQQGLTGDQGKAKFKRTEVHAGKMLDGGRQEVLFGLQPGKQVVTNALLLETAGNQ